MTTRTFLEPRGDLDISTVVDVLGLVSCEVTIAHVSEWTEIERLVAYDYAIREHLRASDNMTVRRRPRPHFVTLAMRTYVHDSSGVIGEVK